jgi:stringent starvation protein B
MSEESTTKPYLIRAIYEWCSDQGYTPYLAVQVDSQTVVPREHVKNGEIILNVGPLATSRLTLGNEFIDFQARFGGVARSISVPVRNVTGIYARENGHGLAFKVEHNEGQGHDVPSSGHDGRDLALAHLNEATGRTVPHERAPEKSKGERPVLSAVDRAQESPAGPDDGPKGRPRLTIVK